MSARSDLREYIQKHGGEYHDIQTVRLGNLDGDVLTETDGVLWARQWNGKEVKVYNRALVPADFDLRVLVGVYRTQPGRWFILQTMEDYLTPAAGGRIGYHHSQHEFDGADRVMLDRRQIIQLSVLVYDGASYIVQVYGSYVRTAHGIVRIASQLVDLSAYVQSAGAVYVNIETDDDGTLSLHEGTNFGSPLAATVSAIPAPAEGKYILAVVMFYEGQTALADTDISVPMPLGVLPKTTGLQIGEATQGTPDQADLFGYWDVSAEGLRSITRHDLMALAATYQDGAHAHGLARWESAGGTTFELPDVAEAVTAVTDDGAVVDPLLYSLSADRTQIVFDSAVTAAHVVTANYLIARI